MRYYAFNVFGERNNTNNVDVEIHVATTLGAYLSNRFFKWKYERDLSHRGHTMKI